MENLARGNGRVWSWAGSEAAADARRREANELIGARIQSVRYYTIDYRRGELHPELIDCGPRTIQDEGEWTEPTWHFAGFDAMDYGLEVTTDSGAAFSLTWDPPGEHEGIGIQNVPMLGSAVGDKADVAIWSVGERAAAWTPMLARPLTGIDLHYIPRDDKTTNWWCPRITFHGEERRVEVVMGDSKDGLLVPSADNVAVLHPGTPLPEWYSLKD